MHCPDDGRQAEAVRKEKCKRFDESEKEKEEIIYKKRNYCELRIEEVDEYYIEIFIYITGGYDRREKVKRHILFGSVSD